ncbi:hypothetical protein LCGC14_3030140, partial [marine sediment metagenome]
MVIETDGSVGIGTNTPDGLLNVFSGSAGAVTARVGGDELVIEHSTNAGMSILTPNTSTSSIIFGSPADPLGADLRWNYDNNKFIIGTRKTTAELQFVSGGGGIAMTIDGDQNVGIGETAPDSKLEVSGTFHVTGNSTFDGTLITNFGDIVSEQNPDAVNAIRLKGTASDVDVVLGDVTDLFSVWNAADTTAVFFVNNVGDTDILGDATITGDIIFSTANAPRILSETSSATNPTIIPNKGSLIAGIGGASGEVDIITNSLSRLNFDSGGTGTFSGDIAVDGGDIISSSGQIAFGDE